MTMPPEPIQVPPRTAFEEEQRARNRQEQIEDDLIGDPDEDTPEGDEPKQEQ
jgi:hypothetical protein